MALNTSPPLLVGHFGVCKGPTGEYIRTVTYSRSEHILMRRQNMEANGVRLLYIVRVYPKKTS